jgi:hypothetical protein
MHFKDLTRFQLERGAVEAVWFYVMYAVIGFLIMLGIGLVILPFLDLGNIEASVLSEKLGRSVAIILSSGLALFVVLAKNYHTNVFYLLLILVSAVLGAWGGLFLGLVVPAVLTTLRTAGAFAPEAGTASANASPLASLSGIFDKAKEVKEERPPAQAGETPKAEVARAAVLTSAGHTPKVKQEPKQEATEPKEPKQEMLVYTKKPETRKESENKKEPEQAEAPGPIKYSGAKKTEMGEKPKTEEVPKSDSNPLLTLPTIKPPSVQKVEPPMVETKHAGTAKKQSST